MINKIIAADTETINGRAFLMTFADGLEEIGSFADCWKALTKRGSTFVFYNLEYDATAILLYLPEPLLKKLYYTHDVNYGNWRIRYIPRKLLRIDWTGGKHIGIKCFDLWTFFQKSLTTACKEYIGKEKNELPDDFFTDFDYQKYLDNKEMFDRYAVNDAIILQDLADKFFESVRAAGLAVRNYYSPASLAKKAVKSWVPKGSYIDTEFMPFIEKAYYGGRVEIHKRGYFPNVNVYDIKSAYPDAMRKIPDILHFSKIWYSDRIESEIYLVEGKVNCDFPIIPYRSAKNTLIYPLYRGQLAVMTSYEYMQILKYGGSVNIKKVLNIDCPPQSSLTNMIETFYGYRSLGGMEKQVYKLVLNSLYGVYAQRFQRWFPVNDVRAVKYLSSKAMRQAAETYLIPIMKQCPEAFRYYEKNCKCEICTYIRRAMRKLPKCDYSIHGDPDVGYFVRKPIRTKTSNLLLAAFITAFVRCRIYDAIHESGAGFIGAMTDSIMTTGEMQTGDQLGDWEKEYSGSLLMLGNGIYQTEKKIRIRGYKIDRTQAEKFDLTKVLHNRKRLMIRLPQTVRQSINSCYSLEDKYGWISADSINVIHNRPKWMRLEVDVKRVWNCKVERAMDLLWQAYESQPFILGENA